MAAGVGVQAHRGPAKIGPAWIGLASSGPGAVLQHPEKVRHEREISNAWGKNWILPKEKNANRLSLAGNLVKPLMSLYGTE
jgi:hypothetical protein